MRPDKKNHADPSGRATPENTAAPSAKGTFNLDDECGPPLWPPLRIDESTATALEGIHALMTRQEGTCQTLGLLPVGYYGEECDFEEFFKPEAVLKMAKGNPLWACLDDTQEYGLRYRLTESVRATVLEMHRAFDHGQPLSARLRMRLLAACRKELAELYGELHAEAQNKPEWEGEWHA